MSNDFIVCVTEQDQGLGGPCNTMFINLTAMETSTFPAFLTYAKEIRKTLKMGNFEVPMVDLSSFFVEDAITEAEMNKYLVKLPCVVNAHVYLGSD